MVKPKKLVALGGGMGTLAALFEITSQDDWQDRYDITLYQMGWRLGGKGASGRNQATFNRIEEHGYHVLFGFYHNTLAMMKAVYAELGRSPNAPISDFYADSVEDERLYPDRYAVKRGNAHTFYPKTKDIELHGMEFELPLNNRIGAERKYPTYVDILTTIYERMQTVYSAADLGEDAYRFNKSRTQPPWWRDFEEMAPGTALLIRAEMNSFLGIDGSLRAAGVLLKQLPKSRKVLRQDFWDLYQFIARLIRSHINTLWQLVKDKVDNDNDAYDLWIRQDFFGTIFVGLIEDDLMENGLDSINNKNFYEWILDKAIVEDGTRITVSSIMVESMYNFGFCFRDGDGDSPATKTPFAGKPDIEAGVMLRIVLRWMFDYEGAPYWFFQVACADALFAPLYEVLARRGVKFKFFHEITKLIAEDHKIVCIELKKQVDLRGDEYEPLVVVKGIPCWPNQPLYGQIEYGDDLKVAINREVGPTDLETPDAKWDSGTHYYPQDLPALKYGHDFDEVLFGIPPGAFTYGPLKDQMCASLREQSDSWKDMVNHLLMIDTEGLQIRLKRSMRDLGWTQPHKFLGMVGVSDLNTFADMPSQLNWESWPRNDADADIKLGGAQYDPKAHIYFVSAMPSDRKGLTPQQHIFEASKKFLNGYFIDIFPKAAAKIGTYYIYPTNSALPPIPPELKGKAISRFMWRDDRYTGWSNASNGAASVLGVQFYGKDDLPGSPPIYIWLNDGAILGAAWAEKDNNYLLGWSNNGSAYVWHKELEKARDQNAAKKWVLSLYRTYSHTGQVYGAAFNPLETAVLTWSDDNKACIWPFAPNVPTPVAATIWHNAPVLDAAWDPDKGENILTCCKDGYARIWKWSDLTKPQIKLPHDGAVLGGRWNLFNTGEYRIITWSDDHKAYVWDFKNGKCSCKYELSHKGPVRGATWLPGKEDWVLTWSDDKTARIWQLPKLKTEDEPDDVADPGPELKHTMHHGSEVVGAAWGPEGNSVATWTEESVNIWSGDYNFPDELPGSGTPAWAEWHGKVLFYGLNDTQFDWSMLVYDPAQIKDPAKATNDDVLRTQFMTANVRPSDRYVLTATNTSKYRLGAADTGFENLFITGDWTRTTLGVGCMEGAAMAGRMAARAMTGSPAQIDGEFDFEIIPPLAPFGSQPLGNAMLNTLDLSVDFYQDLAKAIVLFLQGMRDEVAISNLTQRSLTNLLLGSGGNGNVVSQLRQVVGGMDVTKIDVGRLASLVISELRNQTRGR